MKSLVSVLMIISFVPLSVAAQPIFRCDFDGTLVCDEGKTPASSSVTIFEEGRLGQGVLVKRWGSDFLRYPSAGNLNLPQGTIEMWVRPMFNISDPSTYNFNRLFEYGEFSENMDKDLYMIMFNKNTMKIHARITDGARKNSVLLKSHVLKWKPNETHHVSLSWDKNNVSLFIDGILHDVKQSKTFPVTYTYSSFDVGSDGSINQANAVIDGLRIYDYAKRPFCDGDRTCDRMETPVYCPDECPLVIRTGKTIRLGGFFIRKDAIYNDTIIASNLDLISMSSNVLTRERIENLRSINPSIKVFAEFYSTTNWENPPNHTTIQLAKPWNTPENCYGYTKCWTAGMNVGGWNDSMLDWVLLNTSGEELKYIGWEPYPMNTHWMDLQNEEWARHWKKSVKEVILENNLDGVFADRIIVRFQPNIGIGTFDGESNLLKYSTEESLRTAMGNLLSKYHDQDFLLLPNSNFFYYEASAGSGKLWDQYFNYIDGAWHESWTTLYWGGPDKNHYQPEDIWEDQISAAERFSETGRYFAAYCTYNDTKMFVYCIANYLLAKKSDSLVIHPMYIPSWEGYDAFTWDLNTLVNYTLKKYSGYFDMELGKPLGDRYRWQNVWRRDYEKGLVLVNPDNETSYTIDIGEMVYCKPDLTRVEKFIKLEPNEGFVGWEMSDADVVGDCVADISDLVLIAAHFGRTSDFEPNIDVTGDGKIDIYDIVFVASRFT